MADGQILLPYEYVCERCEERVQGGSHWHCAHCDGQDVTSQLGHYWQDEDLMWRFHCAERGGTVVRSETRELPEVALERLSREQVYAEGIVDVAPNEEVER